MRAATSDLRIFMISLKDVVCTKVFSCRPVVVRGCVDVSWGYKCARSHLDRYYTVASSARGIKKKERCQQEKIY
jgi:hypothetical protein